MGIPKEVLDNFKQQCTLECCIVETFDYWLRHCEEEPTWKDVAQILKLINLRQLALDIESVYAIGNYCFDRTLPIHYWLVTCRSRTKLSTFIT